MQISPWISVDGYDTQSGEDGQTFWVTLLIQYGQDGLKEALVKVELPAAPKDIYPPDFKASRVALDQLITALNDWRKVGKEMYSGRRP
jgi:hypothetical protein